LDNPTGFQRECGKVSTLFSHWLCAKFLGYILTIQFLQTTLWLVEFQAAGYQIKIRLICRLTKEEMNHWNQNPHYIWFGNYILHCPIAENDIKNILRECNMLENTKFWGIYLEVYSTHVFIFILDVLLT